MNPTHIFEFVMNWINQKIIKFNRVPLGRNRSAQMYSAWRWRGPRVRPTATRGATRLSLGRCGARRTAHGASARGAARRAGDDLVPVRGKRLRAVAHRRGTAARHRRASSGRDAGHGPRARTTTTWGATRLGLVWLGPRCTAHGASARATLLGELATTLRQCAGSGSPTRDGGAASTSELRSGRRRGRRGGRDAGGAGEARWLRRGRRGRGDGGAREAVRMRRRAWGGCRAGAARSRLLSRRAARCPDSGFKPQRQRGAWRPRGSGSLPCGPDAAHGG
jgi:hypothetical protein